MLEVELFVGGQVLPVCGMTTLISLPFFTTSVEPIFGLTQIQSTPGGTGMVPLVSMAMSNPSRMHGVDQRAIELQQRFAAGEHHERAGLAQEPADRLLIRSERCGLAEFAAAFAVGADEIGVAKGAERRGAVASHDRSTDCSPKNGRTRPAGPRARPRLARCRKFL